MFTWSSYCQMQCVSHTFQQHNTSCPCQACSTCRQPSSRLRARPTDGPWTNGRCRTCVWRATSLCGESWISCSVRCAYVCVYVCVCIYRYESRLQWFCKARLVWCSTMYVYARLHVVTCIWVWRGLHMIQEQLGMFLSISLFMYVYTRDVSISCWEKSRKRWSSSFVCVSLNTRRVAIFKQKKTSYQKTKLRNSKLFLQMRIEFGCSTEYYDTCARFCMRNRHSGGAYFTQSTLKA